MKKVYLQKFKYKLLPDEIFIEIFEFLPLKSIINLKLSFKRFKNLLESEYFKKILKTKFFPLEPIKDINKNIKLYLKKNTFKIVNEGMCFERGNIKINDVTRNNCMCDWEKCVTKENNGEIVIKRNLLNFYLLINSIIYKIVLYSKIGFSVYYIFEQMDKFKRICLIDDFKINGIEDNYGNKEKLSIEVINNIMDETENIWCRNGGFIDQHDPVFNTLYINNNKLYRLSWFSYMN